MSIEVDIYGAVSLESLLENLDDIQLVDVRSPAEWAEGHFETAIPMPLDTFAVEVDNLDPNKQTVFICAKGFRAACAWKIYQSAFPDAVLNGYAVTAPDYSGDTPVLHVLPEEWHMDIAERLKEI
ncbi:MAG: rhodanese-like domain-containing protein [Alphaproteobacteria bacterium]